jgi:hypothetical protein
MRSSFYKPEQPVVIAPPDKEAWFNTYWRPAAAWTYLGICVFDFVAAPIFFGWFEWFSKTDMAAWTPLTLQGGGLFHLSFGAIIGIYAWNRTREKMLWGSEAPPDIPPDEPEAPKLMAAKKEEG